MIYVQECATCIGALRRVTRVLERASATAVLSELRAARLERRKERPHRLARFVQEAVELRYAAVKNQRVAAHALAELRTIPPTDRCPSCCGRGTVSGNGAASWGIAAA